MNTEKLTTAQITAEIARLLSTTMSYPDFDRKIGIDHLPDGDVKNRLRAGALRVLNTQLEKGVSTDDGPTPGYKLNVYTPGKTLIRESLVDSAIGTLITSGNQILNACDRGMKGAALALGDTDYPSVTSESGKHTFRRLRAPVDKSTPEYAALKTEYLLFQNNANIIKAMLRNQTASADRIGTLVKDTKPKNHTLRLSSAAETPRS